jgi:hypothetical protein
MRIRTIKPEFWSHPVISRLDDSTRLLAIGLLNVADDEGFFFAEPALIRSAIWPFDEDSSRARRTLEQLSNTGYIELREHPTHGTIGVIQNFAKHQRVDRPTPSKLKAYYDSTNPRRGLDERSLLEQGTGNREQGNNKNPLNPPVGDSVQQPIETPELTLNSDPQTPAPKTPKPKKGTQQAELDGLPLPHNSLDFAVCWQEWVKYRIEIKKPLKAISARQQLKTLESIGESRAIAAIRHSIASGYQGIFEPNHNNTHTNHHAHNNRRSFGDGQAYNEF